MIILRMTADHVAALAEIERQCFSTPWSVQALAGELAKEASWFFVAMEEGAVCGYIGCQTVLDEGYITNVAVSPSFRRKGIGRALLRYLKQAAQQNNLAFLTLEVRASNAPAICLYESEGYQRVGARRGFYRNPIEDALLMTFYFSDKQ